MRRLIVVLAFVLSLFVGVASASADQTHTSCQGFGQAVADEAHTFGGNGAQVRTLVPINDDVVAFMAQYCTAP